MQGWYSDEGPGLFVMIVNDGAFQCTEQVVRVSVALPSSSGKRTAPGKLYKALCLVKQANLWHRPQQNRWKFV